MIRYRYVDTRLGMALVLPSHAVPPHGSRLPKDNEEEYPKEERREARDKHVKIAEVGACNDGPGPWAKVIVSVDHDLCV